jgi:hypothetical protein
MIPRRISTTTVGITSFVLNRETSVARAAAQKTRAIETKSGCSTRIYLLIASRGHCRIAVYSPG